MLDVSDKFIFIFCFLLMFIFIPIRINNEKYQTDFNIYLTKFNKLYSTKEEYNKHLGAYKDSIESISELNSLRISNKSAQYGLTAYSDLTANEFLNKHLQLSLFKGIQDRFNNEFKNVLRRNTRNSINLPLKVDWRNQGVITEVNNQQFCGACWAFTVVENIETMYALKTGNLTKFSVQEMIDCAKYNNDGCNGGDMCRLLSWLQDGQIPIRKSTEYPLTLQTNKCQLNSTAEGVKISNFICRNFAHNENVILSILANHGPVITAINALSWQNYLEGVIQYHCSSSRKLLNHAVQIVGYDLTAEIPFYIVRNSWGEHFGENGYLYVSIGNNTCGIANEVIALNIV